ncbi:DUF1592 domain-containing protein [Persicimonas caeni]|uniref:DUF1592 domain-containing protein n=1 Tax=Persicimonas caeni TaxID=2292766 RepID=A0A4Y6PXV9_PERCE|nr:DUF1592 domain-containing protein [Persicimonas caeni]QDG53156.1 DUF1592 domain-containing protein [Persicimonas caeni]QED34378.1 DUF1592 domain-containing protein [Persicimonas caeni]
MPFHRSHVYMLSALSLAALTLACDGYMQAGRGPLATDNGSDGNPTPTSDRVCSRITPGESPLPRLTEAEYNNTLDDLFPSLDVAHLDVPGDEKIGPFDANVMASVGDTIAGQYQLNAEAVSRNVAANIGAVLPCAQTSPEQVYHGEAEEIGGSVGQSQNIYWNLWTNGTLATNFTTDEAGDYEIAVSASGTRAGADLPHMTVTINGDRVLDVDVDAQGGTPKTYHTETTLPSGSHTISVAFTNDFYDEASGNDRNLLVDSISVTHTNRVTADDSCVRGFIDSFGRRAFRRPLSQDESDRLWQLFEGMRAEYGLGTGIRAVVEAALQSPKFLYRFEVGELADDGVVELTDFEVASRLSYFLLDSMPDEQLLSAAEAGELSTKEGVEAQTRRLLETADARRSLNRAFMTWMGLDDLSSVEKEDPDFTPEMRTSMEAATLAFIDQIIWEGDGRLSTLLTAPFAYVDRETAPLYGVEPPDDDSIVRVDLDGEKRLGLLTQPAVLARYAYGDTTVHRGLFIRDAFFCSRPPPPPNEFEDPPETYEGQPARERAEDRMNHQQCGACHKQIDPLGLAFDEFDGMGRWTETDEHGNPVHDSGAIYGTSSTDQEVRGPVELARALAESGEVRQCVVRQWFRLAFARTMTREDACSLQQLEEALQSSDDDIRELIVTIATSDAFRYRLAYDAQ